MNLFNHHKLLNGLVFLLLFTHVPAFAQHQGQWDFAEQHQMINGTDVHYIQTGKGAPILLLHGFPETKYTWRYIIPQLAQTNTVIAVDLPGLGNSSPSLNGYNQKTIADLLHSFMVRLGYEKTAIIAHDLGVEMAYGYVSLYPESVTKLVFLDVPIATETMEQLPLLSKDQRVLWWFAFHNVQDLPEKLIKGKEDIYLNWFFKEDAYNQVPFTTQKIGPYVKAYRKNGTIHAAMEYYRAMLQNIDINKENIRKKLRMPVLALGGEKSFGIQTLRSFQPLGNNVTGGVIENCGHFIQEEQPDVLLDKLAPFLKD